MSIVSKWLPRGARVRVSVTPIQGYKLGRVTNGSNVNEEDTDGDNVVEVTLEGIGRNIFVYFDPISGVTPSVSNGMTLTVKIYHDDQSVRTEQVIREVGNGIVQLSSINIDYNKVYNIVEETYTITKQDPLTDTISFSQDGTVVQIYTSDKLVDFNLLYNENEGEFKVTHYGSGIVRV